jgi:DNA repair protein RadC
MGMLRIREMAPEERPRERLLEHGGHALKTTELLAILLRTGMKGRSALALAEEMLQRYGSLEALGRAPANDLLRLKGIGKSKAVQLAAAFALGARLRRASRAKVAVDTPTRVYHLLGDEMRLLAHESLRVISLNAKYHLLAIDEITRGSVSESLFPPREILRAVIARQAYAFILVHNHPSGDPTPSAADARVTASLRQAAELLQIPFLDHVILGAPGPKRAQPWFSFREHGTL